MIRIVAKRVPTARRQGKGPVAPAQLDGEGPDPFGLNPGARGMFQSLVSGPIGQRRATLGP